jgi:hypothetical protein
VYTEAGVLAFADRLAAVQAFHHGQFMRVLFQQAGEAQQRVLALVRRQPRPAAILIGRLGVGHGDIHVFRTAGGDVGQHLAGGRVGGLEGFAR